MAAATFACPKCQAVFAIEPGKTEIVANCPTCTSLLEAHFFPAFFRPLQVGAAAAALVDHTEASCFYHPQKQAVRVCDGCGRLVCALCSIDMGDQHLCPACISSGKKKGKITTLENSRVRYDNIAMSLAIFGILLGSASCGVLTLLMEPAAIYISIRHWNTPGSLLGRGRTRFVIAIVIAVLAICFGIGFAILALMGRTLSHGH